MMMVNGRRRYWGCGVGMNEKLMMVSIRWPWTGWGDVIKEGQIVVMMGTVRCCC
jgi:hypothetical protein